MGAFLQEVTSINPEVEKRIGHNIRQLREKAGLTQEWVAAQLQLSGLRYHPQRGGEDRGRAAPFVPR